MKTAENFDKLIKALGDFNKAHHDLLMAIDDYETATGKSVNDLQGFTESYPFDKSLDELAIHSWVHDIYASVNKVKFQVIGYEYLNTGGNCMVGIHDVWLPDEKKVVYVYTNEEGSTISTVDYIRHALEIDDYDELVMDYIDWGRATGYETYFELYRRCLSDYTKDDCKYFGITRGLPYHLLSDELQKQIDADYIVYCETEHGGLINTDGHKVVVYPDYENTADEDKQLEAIKEFKRWHDTIAGVEKYYEEEYTLTFAGRTIKLPFMADVWDAVDRLLERTIEEW